MSKRGTILEQTEQLAIKLYNMTDTDLPKGMEIFIENELRSQSVRNRHIIDFLFLALETWSKRRLGECPISRDEIVELSQELYEIRLYQKEQILKRLQEWKNQKRSQK